MWATHANYLNDTAECRLLGKLLAPQVKAEIDQLIPRLNGIGLLTKGALADVESGATGEQAEKIIGVLLRAIEGVSPIFVTSFCRHATGSDEAASGLLSQWRGYGRGGFAIEFDEKELDALTQLEYGRFRHAAIITRHVEYDVTAVKERLHQFDGMAASALRAILEDVMPGITKRQEVFDILGGGILDNYMEAFIGTAPLLKSAAFREENEYRMVALTVLKGHPREEGDGRPEKDLCFRAGENGAVLPYIELFRGLGRSLPIKKIIVGPHRDQENQFVAAQLLLRQFGVQAELVRSNISFRG